MQPKFGITGARGVLGRYLVAVLNAAGPPVEQFAGDVRDHDAVDEWVLHSGVTSIIHGAAIVPVDRVAADPGAAIAVNVGGTANVAQAAQRHGARLVYISSSHVYGPQNTPLHEADVTMPPSDYGWTKLQGEQWCRRLTDDYVIARAFSYFAPEQPSSFVVGNLRERALAAPPGADLAVRGFGSRRDFATAEWLAAAIVALARTDLVGAVNVGTGVATSIGSLAVTVAAQVGRDDLRVVADGDPTGNTLVADTTLLSETLGGVPPFNLDAELRRWHAAA